LSWEELGKTQVKIDPSQNDVQLSGRTAEDVTQILKGMSGQYYPVGVEAEILDDLSSLLPTTHAAARILWMGDYEDKQLILYKIYNDVYFSGDGGATSVRVGPAGLYGTVHFGLVVPNKSIVLYTVNDTVSDGRCQIWVSNVFTNANETNWELKFTTSAGGFSATWGRSNYGDVIVLATYGVHNAENPARFLYISRDAGNTWKEVEVVKIEEMDNPSWFHLHDVEYDPWTSRIWVGVGDGTGDTGIMYTDDWGDTWTRVVSNVPGQPTCIIALPDRILFGRDYRPAGWSVWYKPINENLPTVTAADIHFLQCPTNIDASTPATVFIPNINWAMAECATKEYPYSLATLFAPSTYPQGFLDCARIVASPDGEHWFEIFRADILGDEYRQASISGLVGPVMNDEDRYIYANIFSGEEKKILRIKYPTWVKKQ
jgi:hypothetical protein